ncbi:MAG: hypothetical protein PHR82_05350 [Endomicrobiaceae bacterium]|nr:hypothetical protein [Endomicrobiaceae bacterium]
MAKMFSKSFLIILGLVFGLLLCELLMWVASLTVSNYQKYKNEKISAKNTQHTIICIGESTTFEQYPRQLQEFLDKKYPNKFSVVDCGVPGISLEMISQNIDKNIDKYNPDIAICMMGINETFIQKYAESNDINKRSFLDNFKIYKFYKILNTSFDNKSNFHDTRQLLKNINRLDSLLKEGIVLFYSTQQNDNNKGKDIFQFILAKNPKDEIAFYFMNEIMQRTDFKIAVEMSKKAVDANFKFMRFSYYMKIIQYYIQENNMPMIKHFIEKAYADEIPSINMDLYGMIENLISPEQKKQILKMIFKNYQTDDVFYGFMAIDCLGKNDYKNAGKYFAMAEKSRLQNANPKVKELYCNIVKKLVSKNIKILSMQYPVRSVESLKNILKDEKYYDTITFVSNETFFKQALKEKKYKDIFTDQFGGDFGHCTYLGNTFIAKQLVEILDTFKL